MRGDRHDGYNDYCYCVCVGCQRGDCCSFSKGRLDPSRQKPRRRLSKNLNVLSWMSSEPALPLAGQGDIRDRVWQWAKRRGWIDEDALLAKACGEESVLVRWLDDVDQDAADDVPGSGDDPEAGD